MDPVFDLPEQVSVIHPYRSPEVMDVLKKFCDKFYGTDTKRTLILGINSGRFGAGVTGIPFTDPINLETKCNIPHNFPLRHELSSKFIYEMIDAYGGPAKFYNNFLLNAVCPVGFLNGKINYNYYDSPALLKATEPFIKQSLIAHATWNTSNTVISLGKKNAEALAYFNKELKLFTKIVTLEHPRYIMQYKLKLRGEYIQRYLEVFDGV